MSLEVLSHSYLFMSEGEYSLHNLWLDRDDLISIKCKWRLPSRSSSFDTANSLNSHNSNRQCHPLLFSMCSALMKVYFLINFQLIYETFFPSYQHTEWQQSSTHYRGIFSLQMMNDCSALLMFARQAKRRKTAFCALQVQPNV